MRGLNVKRIAALAAGAALLGASLAVAGDVTFQNQQIINQNGQPVVKIVVGKNAAASDGIAAANIAAVIGNLAYKSQTITASVSGQATCTVTAGAGTGVCPISNKKVTLDVTLPGSVSGAYGWKTLITDYVDKQLENRLNNQTVDRYDGTYPGIPWQVAPTLNKAVLRIDGTSFAPLATTSPRDPYSSNTYTEEQGLWVQATTIYDTTLKQVVAKAPNVAYEVIFTQDQYGIPVCTSKATDTSGTRGDGSGAKGNWADCRSATDATDRHRVPVKFLGGDWIISQMTNPTTALASSTTEINGGTVKLAKESAYGIIHVGEALNVSGGAYTIKLADITVPTGGSYDAKASIEIRDANGVLQKEDQISAVGSGTLDWTAPDGSRLRIRVYKTNPGYTLAAKWAEMAIYSQELELRDGERVDDNNADWLVNLWWKNKDYANNSGSNDTMPDALRRILLIDEAANNALIKMQKGGGFDIITQPSVWQLSYDGLTLGNADYDSLSFTIIKIDTGSPIKVTNTQDCATYVNVSGNLVYVSGPKDYFTVGTGGTGSKFYWNSNVNSTAGAVYFQPSGVTQCYYNVTGSVTYNPGDRVQTLGLDANLTGTITIPEYAGGTPELTDSIYLTLNKTDPSRHEFMPTDKNNYSWATPTSENAAARISQEEMLFVTERGSQFVAKDKSTASFKIAKKVAEAQYYVKSTGSASGATTTVGPLAEGETASLTGGVTIKVNSITQTVGACQASGSTCAVDQAGLSAALSTGGSSVKAVTMFKVDTPLVVTDASTPSAATVIGVGGPDVNGVVKTALAGSAVTFTTGTQITQVYGNTIVVAGTTGADTTAAADALIRALQAQA